MKQNARKEWWTLSLLHASFALLTPLVLFWMVGCEGVGDGPEDVDYGPEFTSADINDKLSSLIRDSDPTQTQAGAYVHFSTSDDVSEGEMNIIVADTYQQVSDRRETDSTVVYDLVETKANYHQSSNVANTLTRGFTLTFTKAEPTAQAQMMPFISAAIANSDELKMRIGSLVRPNDDSGSDPNASPTPTPSATPDPGTTRVTFHHLKAWEDSGAAPAAVLARPNCLGLSNCQLAYRHVSFDMVIWSDPKGERLHFDLTTSPQIPQTIGYQMSSLQNYIPGLMRSCLTQLVPVKSANQTTKTLIKECQSVEDFRFAAE